MAIFKNRPLAMACALLIASAFLCYLFPISFCLILGISSGAIAALLAVYAFFRGLKYRVLLFILLALALCLGAFRVYTAREGAQRLWAPHVQEEVTAELSVIEVLQSNAYGAELLVRVETLNGEKESSRAILRCHHAQPFYTQDRFVGRFTVQELDYDAYSESAVSSYMADGAKALLISESTQGITFLESGSRHPITRLNTLRAVLSFRISSAVKGEAGHLLSAMLLGTRENLSDSTAYHFRLSGVSHLLALSGLHLLILVGILDRILYFLCASKRVRVICVLPLCFFYLMLTGFNYSLIRASLMLCVAYLAFLFGTQKDGMTALCLAGAVIALLSPPALYSVSFQMTILSTFGILCFGKLQGGLSGLFRARRGLRGIPGKLLRAVLSSLLISLGSTVCMLPVLYLTIGSFSLATPFSNLILVPLAPLLLFVALILMIFPIPALGAVLGIIPKAVLQLTEWIASFQPMISLKGDHVPYILLPYLLLTGVFLLVKLKKHRYLTLVPTFLAIIAFALATVISHTQGQERLSVVYRRAGTNEGMILVQNSEAVIFDISNGSTTQLRADWKTAQDHGATKITSLILTHYHNKLIASVSILSQNVAIESIYLPEVQSEKEEQILVDFLNMARKREWNVQIYAPNEKISVLNNVQISTEEHLWEKRSAEPVLTFTVAFKERTICYHSSAHSEYCADLEASHACAANMLILGAHGPIPHKEILLPQTEELENVLVGSEKALSMLRIRDGLAYLFYPEKHVYFLE